MLGINLLVRKQWTIHEKLAYPLAQIPLDIISNGPRVFKTPLTWVGFSIAVGINVLNGINHFFPNVPGIFARPFLIHPYLTTKPWNTMGWLEINVHLFAVGLAYFMPLDLAFSCWFFYWLWRLEALIGSAFFGVPGSGGVAFSFFSAGRFPYSQEQPIGTCASILLMAAWGLRPVGRGILDSFSSSFSGQKQCRGSSQNQGNGSITDAAEDADLRRYRWASIAILASLCYLIAFCHLAGMSIWVATLFFFILFAVSIVVTRVRIEAGYPMHDFVFRPEDMLVAGFGTRTIGPKNLTLFSFLHFLTYAQRSNPQPHQLESFKLADRMNLNMNRLLIAGILIAAVIGAIGGCWAYLHTTYRYHVLHYHPAIRIFSRLQNWLTYPQLPDFTSLGFMGVGLGIGMWFLMLRRLFVWWPLHPAGYIIGGTWSLNFLWFSIFLTWAAKIIILRFGGIKRHQQAGRLFVGFVLGEFVMVSLWGLIGTILGERTYRFI